MATKRTKHLKYIDLRDGYDNSPHYQELLVHFYNTIMKKYFPIEDELDPLDVWEKGLSSSVTNPILPELHVVLAIDTMEKEQNVNLPKIAGGCMFEYYKMSNCALLSYFVVTDEYQNLGLGRILVEHAYQISKQIAVKFNGKHHRRNTVLDIIHRVEQQLSNDKVCDEELLDQYKFVCEYLKFTLEDPIPDQFYAFVAETNAVGVDDGIMASQNRHQIMNRIGFKLLDFEYIQPPLSDEQQPCADLLLLTLHVEDLPFDEKTKKHFVQTSLLKCFMLEFLYSVFEHVENITDSYLQHVLKDLHHRGNKLFVDVKPTIPWMRRTSWKSKL